MLKVILSVLLLGICAGNVYNLALSSPKALLSLFSQYQGLQNKHYVGGEARMRMRLFKESVSFVSEQIRRGGSWETELNKFSDMTEGEKQQYLGLNTTLTRSASTAAQSPVDNVPTEKNWIALGAVTETKDQASCGSCWTFGSTASIEGAYAVATGKLKRFAEQELLECTYMLRNGCTGGLNSDAIEGVIKRQHHSTDTVMPYKAKDYQLTECNLKRFENGLKSATVTSLEAVGNMEQDSIAALNNGVLATSVHSTNNFFYYKKGILRDTLCDPIRLNHAVTAVAYTAQWYLIKNSWGAKWGQGGFIKLARNHHNCGVWIHPYRPIMTLTGNTDDDAAAPANVYDPTNEPTESPTEEDECVDEYPHCTNSSCAMWVYREKFCQKTCNTC